ncbi:hypothetical protein QNK12_14020 [Neobacillus cucumis]|nr:hypothetical protein QNK12_14020 [Neobacillus cucumis]
MKKGLATGQPVSYSANWAIPLLIGGLALIIEHFMLCMRKKLTL